VQQKETMESVLIFEKYGFFYYIYVRIIAGGFQRMVKEL